MSPSHPDRAPGAEIVRQIRRHGMDDSRVLDAMARLSRGSFLSAEHRESADADRPLPIGCEQTLSQPYMVAVMTSELSLSGAEKVLEVGTGSGYQTAVLSALAREVFTIERHPLLSLRARGRLDGLGLTNVRYLTGDGSLGWPEEAPFDRTIVTAGVPRFPSILFSQLREGGRLVAPIGGEDGQTLTVITRQDGLPVSRMLMGCRFVKMIGEDGWDEP